MDTIKLLAAVYLLIAGMSYCINLAFRILQSPNSMNHLEQLRHQYLKLTNCVLPELAQNRSFPVQHNHCFQRIILDNLFGCCWYEALSVQQKPAYKQLTEAQLEQAIALAKAIIAQPDVYLHQLNQNSLSWRKKLRKGVDRSG
jgi:hypothetical protein